MPCNVVIGRLRAALSAPTQDAALTQPRASAGQREAAVALIVLASAASLEVLLIERAERALDPWSGHMALPGGRSEPGDVDLGATAERETLEEVGLDLAQAGERLGRLSDHEPVRGVPIRVRPFVYLLDARPVLAPNREVKQAFWVPIEPLQSGAWATTYRHTRGADEREFPAWDIDGRLVWGLTYRVLDEFFRRYNAVSARG